MKQKAHYSNNWSKKDSQKIQSTIIEERLQYKTAPQDAHT